MGKIPKRSRKQSGKKRATPKRLAKMVTADTSALIDLLSEALIKERDMESRVSDNDSIRTAVREALDRRGIKS